MCGKLGPSGYKYLCDNMYLCDVTKQFKESIVNIAKVGPHHQLTRDTHRKITHEIFHVGFV